MEIILNCGDKIKIPDGCKAEIKDGVITIEKEEPKFKDGDILVDSTISFLTYPFIVKGEWEDGCYRYYVGVNKGGDLSFPTENEYWTCERARLATEKEKQMLFDRLEKQGLRWNAIEKRLEDIRWRAKEGDAFYYIDSMLVVSMDHDNMMGLDNKKFLAYNYFKTREQAEKATELIKETLKKFHEDNESNK